MLAFPHDFPLLFRKRRSLTRARAEQAGLAPVRIAMLGGPTTQELASWLELFLLDRGIKPVIYQSEYNKYFEDTVLDSSALVEFAPDLVYLHLTSVNLQVPNAANEEELEAAVRSRLDHFAAVWGAVWSALPCQIIMNTFETPALRPLGHLDASSFAGASHFVARLNRELVRAARINSRLLLHDAASLAATSGVAWHAPDRWYSYKIPTSPEADVVTGHSLASLIAAARGRSRKVLVLDLDNTMWGGVIGDDGPDKIVIGRETPRGEAYTAFQEYARRLKDRGVLLAVCSKNDDAMARRGFSHPDSVLRIGDFAAFVANWEPKHQNIEAIARQLNLGLDSFVFVDDNPAERHLVEAQLPMVAVPNVGDDVCRYPAIIDAARYFETISLSAEDAQRTALYAQNAEREALAQKFEDYDAYLASLGMVGEIDAFSPVYLDRITQLTNKTNQFNLTTRRYTKAEMEAVAADPEYITLYGRLTDVFGDNGLVSVVIGRRDDRTLHVDLWLMSCRVLKRGMEDAMLDALVLRARQAGVDRIVGYYIPTARNGMVAEHYSKLGFTQLTDDGPERTSWCLELAGEREYSPRNRHIRHANGGGGEKTGAGHT
ncbi:MAG TPA: HAD-IIIC family phosphatase [Gemmatimonadaceae bacterium]|nr:HAD-IIIC family phosphatase [Gemmatimonadaceae bacterium]